MADNLTQKQMLEIMLNEFKEYRNEWKEYQSEQKKVNELVIRHDEQLKGHDDKIKGLWKVPVISGGVVSLISGIAIFIGMMS